MQRTPSSCSRTTSLVLFVEFCISPTWLSGLLWCGATSSFSPLVPSLVWATPPDFFDIKSTLQSHYVHHLPPVDPAATPLALVARVEIPPILEAVDTTALSQAMPDALNPVITCHINGLPERRHSILSTTLWLRTSRSIFWMLFMPVFNLPTHCLATWMMIPPILRASIPSNGPTRLPGTFAFWVSPSTQGFCVSAGPLTNEKNYLSFCASFYRSG
jgi:hypothetical protein